MLLPESIQEHPRPGTAGGSQAGRPPPHPTNPRKVCCFREDLFFCGEQMVELLPAAHTERDWGQVGAPPSSSAGEGGGDPSQSPFPLRGQDLLGAAPEGGMVGKMY